MILFSSKLLKEPVNQKSKLVQIMQVFTHGLKTWLFICWLQVNQDLIWNMWFVLMSYFKSETGNWLINLSIIQKSSIFWSFIGERRLRSNICCFGLQQVLAKYIEISFHKFTWGKYPSLKGSPWTISTSTRLALGVVEDNSMSSRFTLGSTLQWPPCMGPESLPIARSSW